MVVAVGDRWGGGSRSRVEVIHVDVVVDVAVDVDVDVDVDGVPRGGDGVQDDPARARLSRPYFSPVPLSASA